MAKKGMTDKMVEERERAAFKRFHQHPKTTVTEMLAWLKEHHKFGMRPYRLYELKRLAAAGGEYQPKERKKRGEHATPKPVPKPQQAARKGGNRVPHHAARKSNRQPQQEQVQQPQQAARNGGDRVPGPFQNHPALVEAHRVLEQAGFMNVRIDALAPIHYEEPARAAV